jgi:dipeptidase D
MIVDLDRFLKHAAHGMGLLFIMSCSVGTGNGEPSARAREVAEHARAAYSEAAVATLADMVSFRTVRREGVENAANPEFRAMSAYLERKAIEFGFDFTDHGAVIVVGLGKSGGRLGLVTHGDVQPADSSKWAQDPFSLDTVSEPGRLVGRGSMDDKGPIVAALHAMKAVKDREVPLARRIELIISLTEESDWQPFRDFLAANDPPDLNVALDSAYPVVVAEKSWNSIHMALPPDRAEPVGAGARLASFGGGVFLAQIPEDAQAIIADPTPELEARLRARGDRDPDVGYSFVNGKRKLTVNARGLAAHSSRPWNGKNAICHLAALLGSYNWPNNQAARMVRLINNLVGAGNYGEKFGEVALKHPFMGRLTLTLTTLGLEDGDLVAGINIRSPSGRSPNELERLIHEAVDVWKESTGIDDLQVTVFTEPPYYIEEAMHVPVLLDVFAYYTGRPDPQPIAIGGGTHARLMPSGVSFGPAMPGEPATGHSEHEYLTREQLDLSLEMYAAMLVELAGGRSDGRSGSERGRPPR